MHRHIEATFVAGPADGMTKRLPTGTGGEPPSWVTVPLPPRIHHPSALDPDPGPAPLLRYDLDPAGSTADRVVYRFRRELGHA